MNKTLVAAAVAALTTTVAQAETIGVSMQSFDNNFQTLLRLGLEKRAGELPDNQAYVGSKEVDAGRLAGEATCKMLANKDKAGDSQGYILMGDLVHDAARTRTSSFKEAMAAGDCASATIADEQSGGWMRNTAMDLTTNWITAGQPIDAIFANNDEMAIGAVQALKAAGVSMDDVIIAGIDATSDGLQAMSAGELDATVFQNATAQAAGAVDTAVSLIKGEAGETEVWVPFKLVTPENMADYAAKN